MADTYLSAPLQNASTPTYNSTSGTLWGHLLHKKPHASLATKGNVSQTRSTPLIAPADKAGASARMLLHDTQATLERFSVRNDKLTAEVQDAKKEISTSYKVFQHGNEKLLEEQVNLVNRCQTQIQKSLGKPAQAAHLEELNQAVKQLDKQFEALERRFDALHMLNQTQIQTLQTIQEQQGKLLAVIGPLPPLLDAVPLRIDVSKNELKEMLRELSCAASDSRSEISAFREDVAYALCPSPSRSPPRKRRRVEGSTSNLRSSLARPATDPSSANSVKSPVPTSDFVSCPSSPSSSSALSRKLYVQPPRNSLYYTPQLESSSLNQASPDLAQSLAENIANPVPSHGLFSTHPCPSDLLIDSVGLMSHQARAAVKNCFAPSDSAGYTISDGMPLAEIPMTFSTISTSPTCESTVFKTTPALTSDSDPLHQGLSQSCEPGLLIALSSSSQHNNSSFAPGYSSLPLSTINASASGRNGGLDEAPAIVTTTSALPLGSSTAFSTGNARPMSLKDRRARGLRTEALTRNSGKRFIPVDEQDEDEFEGEIL